MMTKTLRTWILGTVLTAASAPQALACAFHGYTPNPTLVDLLLATEQVVFAQLDPADPGQYSSVKTLVGPDAIDIPIAPDAATRQRLSRNPNETILLARDGAYGAWLELALLDPGYRRVIEDVMQNQSAWSYGDDAGRAALFARHVNDPNPELRRLALQELDRAPYATLQDLRLPPINGLKQDMRSGDPDLTPIRVLLAGLSGDQGFAPILQTDLDRAIQANVPYIGAYATALIELQGADGVDTLADRYISSKSLSFDTREKLLEALAIQYQTAPATTRNAITRNLAGLLRSSPELKEAASRQFGLYSHWSRQDPAAQTTQGADR